MKDEKITESLLFKLLFYWYWINEGILFESCGIYWIEIEEGISPNQLILFFLCQFNLLEFITILRYIKSFSFYFIYFSVINIQVTPILSNYQNITSLMEGKQFKKKYVRKEDLNISPSNQRPTNQNLNHLSLTYVSDSNQNKSQSDPLYQGEFQFECKQILHLWLAEILPGPGYKGLTYDFPAKKIKGNRRQCMKKQEQCSFFLKSHKLKLYEEYDLLHNQQLFLQKSLQIKIFRKYLLQKATKDLVQNYKLNELKAIMEPILSKKYVCLMSIMQKDEQIFIKLVQKIQTSGEINRSDIKIAQQERIKRQKQYMRNKKKQQSFDVSVNFSKSESDKSSSSESLSSSSDDEQMKEMAKIAKKSKHNTENVIKDELIFSRKLNKKQFDIALLREWIKDNRKLSLKQQDIQVDQDNNMIEINIFTAENKQKKLKDINFYLKYDKLISFIRLEEDLLQKLKDFVKSQNLNQTVCQHYERFTKPKTKQNQIQKLFKQNKLSQKKSRNNSQKVFLISIQGIKPNVEIIYNEILEIQNDFKKKNTIITKNFILNIKSVEQYLKEKRVFDFLKQIIRQIFDRIKQIKLVDIFCPQKKISLKVEMKLESNQYYDRFTVQIEKQIEQKIKVEDIMDIDDLSQQMKQQYLLFQSKSNPSRVVLIEQKDKLMSSTKQILSEHQLKKQAIVIKKNRLPLIKEFIESLKVKESKIMKIMSFNYINNPDITQIQIIGIKYTKKVKDLINQQLSRLDDQILEKTMLLSDLQASIVEKNILKFEKQIQKQEKLSFVLSKNISIEAIITLGLTKEPKVDDPTVICIYKQKCLSFLPKKTTLIFLSELDLIHIREAVFEDVKQVFQGKKQWNQVHSMQDGKSQFTFIYYPLGLKDINEGINRSLNISTLLKNSHFTNMNQHQHYAFFMPKDKKFQFVTQIINIFYEKYRDLNSKIFIFENNMADTTDLINSLQQMSDNCNSPKTKTQYFIMQKGQELFYSATGNKKIQEALKKGQNKVELTNSDLNLKQNTHLCSFKQEKMRHILTKKETILDIYPDRVSFVLNGIQFQMPSEQVKKVEKKNKSQDWIPVSIGAYQIDFSQNVQTNLFTGFQRVLQKKQISFVNPFGKLFLNLSVDHKINEVQICYRPGQEQNAIRALQNLENLIKQQQIRREYKIRERISKQKFSQLKEYSKDLNIQMEWDGQKLITLNSCDKYTIELMIKSLDMLTSQKNQKISYPQYWSPQTYIIQTFIVSPNSKEFMQIQAAFKILPIKELIRIQNKQVYDNYIREKEFLKNLNEGRSAKEMMLYHGTKSTDPKIIYEDRQSCFNINYTSDFNYMGRAIYFAEQALYSKTYQHSYEQNGQRIGCMFYCSVLVGESEHFPKENESTKQLKNANFKNYSKRLRYQSSSMVTSKSKIYAVYQNRRAYPHYLIKYQSTKRIFNI